MTRRSAWISVGGALRDLVAEAEHPDPVGDADDEIHGVDSLQLRSESTPGPGLAIDPSGAGVRSAARDLDGHSSQGGSTVI